MILLDATDRSLTFLLAGTVTTNQLTFVVNYKIGAVDTRPSNDQGVSNDTTRVTIVSAPTSKDRFNVVESFFIHNADTASATVTVAYSVGTTHSKIWEGALAAGDTLQYNDAQGFLVV